MIFNVRCYIFYITLIFLIYCPIKAAVQNIPTKRLHIIPVTYNPATHEFQVLLRKVSAIDEYIDFLTYVPSLIHIPLPAVYMPTFSAQTFGVYPVTQVPIATSHNVFDRDGKDISNEHALVGYIYVEVPLMRGQTLYEAGQRVDPLSDFAWIQQSAILNLKEGHSYGKYACSSFPINISLLRVLKATLPKLKRIGDVLQLKEFENAAQAVECPICFETKPLKTLACGHKLCAECLTLIEQKADASCPICRAPLKK